MFERRKKHQMPKNEGLIFIFLYTERHTLFVCIQIKQDYSLKMNRALRPRIFDSVLAAHLIFFYKKTILYMNLIHAICWNHLWCNCVNLSKTFCFVLGFFLSRMMFLARRFGEKKVHSFGLVVDCAVEARIIK